MSRTIILLPLIFITSFLSKGQTSVVYNINKYNGLSTNHVYHSIVDKLGYLWISTNDGVYRYNGYVVKKFGYNEGMPNTDIWDFYKDTKGRIWLLSVAEDIGYIQHGRFTTVARHLGKSQMLYPQWMSDLGDSLIFRNQISDANSVELCIVANDTLYTINRRAPANVLCIANGKIIETADSHSVVNIFPARDWINNRQGGKQRYIPGLVARLSLSTRHGLFFDKYIYTAVVGDNEMYIYDIENMSIDTLRIGHSLVHCFPGETSFHVLTQTRLMTYDSSLRLTSTIDLATSLSPVEERGMYTYALPDTFWQLCVSTSRAGLFINYPRKGEFYKIATKLDGYRFSGYVNDTTGAWWNDKTRQMAYVSNGKIITQQNILADEHIKVITSNSSKALMANSRSAIWVSPYKTPANAPNGYNFLYINRSKTPNPPGAFWNIKDAIIFDTVNMLLVRGGGGLDNISLHPKDRSIYLENVVSGNYKAITYSAKNNMVVIYHDHKILVLTMADRRKTLISSKQLALLGIRGIEAVFCDDYGNIIIKDYSGLYSYNWHTRRLKRLFKNFGLEKSIVFVKDNMLYVAGSFGVIRSTLTGPNQLADIRVYRNVKNIFYNYVTDAQFSPSSALLKTDKGLYKVNINANADADLSSQFRVILSLNDTLCRLATADTLEISQDVNTIAADIINPTGMGTLKMEYSINGGDYNNTGMQVILPQLSPGSYNTISFIASDDSWRSKPLKFTVYIQPYWWQTTTAKAWFLVLGILGFIGFVYIVIVATRRIVNRNNERRNQRRELELKSIYSQINPHFIFNSLSTAQYFVKKNKNKEAFEHINQFSDLLRAYIKSSRAKYITIAEEIENLENYLQLQLTRFEEKFDYVIKVDKSVDAEKVKIPSLLLQPLVENALNHGIFHSDKKGNLSVIFKIDEQDKDTLVCIVDDDGIGRQRAKELRSKIIRKADSYGTILIKELIDTFNKYEDIKIEIDYIDKQAPLSGTTVIVKINRYTYVS